MGVTWSHWYKQAEGKKEDGEGGWRGGEKREGDRGGKTQWKIISRKKKKPDINIVISQWVGCREGRRGEGGGRR